MATWTGKARFQPMPAPRTSLGLLRTAVKGGQAVRRRAIVKLCAQAGLRQGLAGTGRRCRHCRDWQALQGRGGGLRRALPNSLRSHSSRGLNGHAASEH